MTGKVARKQAVVGIVGWSGQGKTELVVGIVQELCSRGYTVSTIKHAHHAFDVDKPGKDSFRHRSAGASEVLITSGTRWALLHENRDQSEPGLQELIGYMSPVDLVVVEGFKNDDYDKIEVYRPKAGNSPLYPDDPRIIAVATDSDIDPQGVLVLNLNHVPEITDYVVSRFMPAN